MKPSIWISAAFVFCIASHLVADERDASPNLAAEFMREWHELNCDVTGVRCSFNRLCYDYTFRVVGVGKGELARISEEQAFLRIKSAVPKDEDAITKTISNREFTYVGERPEYIRWEPGFVQMIDGARNLSQTIEIGNLDCSKRTNSFWEISRNFRCAFSRIDNLVPFLPGQPSASVLEEWRFNIDKHTDSHVTISATRKNAGKQPFAVERCDLYFKKTPVQLLAIRLHQSDSRDTTVYKFKDVEKNSKPWDESWLRNNP